MTDYPITFSGPSKNPEEAYLRGYRRGLQDALRIADPMPRWVGDVVKTPTQQQITHGICCLLEQGHPDDAALEAIRALIAENGGAS